MNIIKNILDKIAEYRHDKIYRPLGINNKEIKRLKKEKGEKKTVLFGRSISITNFFWYIHGLDEIFLDETYQFNTNKESPVIIDCGANIGLSVIYFKRLYPESKIIAFEADKNIADILTANLNNFEYNDIEIIPKAVWTENTTLWFKSDGAVGGQIANNEIGTINIEAIRLKDYLSCEIDFLKIDIEGVEYEILKDCAGNLSNVKNIFIEYHSFLKNEQKLNEILLILKEAGFKYYIKEAWNNMPNPYINNRTSYYDLQLNIFGYRI
jgi:FkbM family methyltransferase